MIGPMHAVPEIKRTVDWGYYSVPQKHILDRKMPVPRGKVLGGSSSINGMVYVRGNRANYDSWAAEGCTGWDADSVNAAYQRMEDYEGGADQFRGEGGPIRVTVNKTPQEGLVFGLGSGAGFALAVMLLAGARARLAYADLPRGLRGLGIAFAFAGMMSLGFAPFAQMVAP